MLEIVFLQLLASASALECPFFNSIHCQADCSTFPIDMKCEAVSNEELSALLSNYGNMTVTPLRLTIKRSPNLQLRPSLFAPVVPLLWDLRVEADTIVNEIPKDSFVGLTNLRYLDLSGNKIAHLHEQDFAGLEQLRGLKVGKNPLIGISAGVFDKLKNLHCLDIDENALTCDCKLLWLKKWALDHPQFWKDDQELYKSKDKDSHEDLEDCDGDMPECEYPPLMHDRNVTDIPADVCDGFITEAECLEIQSEHCKFYCDNWMPMQIQCSGVEFAELLRVLEKYSRYSDRLLRLDIAKSSNLVLNISLWEPVKDQLIHLNVHHSKMTLRADTFANLNKLVYLQLDDDEISVMPSGVFNGLGSLKGLSLDDSMVDHFDGTTFAPLTSLTCLKLEAQDDNLCDCDMHWLQNWSRNHSQYFTENALMYDYGVKVFCNGDSVDCAGKLRSNDDC